MRLNRKTKGRGARAAAPAAGLLLACLLLSACAGTPVSDSLVAASPPELPRKAELTETPFFPQTAYYCGPAAMAAALNATGLETAPDSIASQLFTPGREGTLQADVVTAARRNGRLAVPISGMADAFSEVAAGRPVLILQNLGLEMAPQWHYALLIGYDLDAEEAILRSGTTKRLVMDIETLEHTWRRAEFWGVIVTPPGGPVPVTADVSAWLAEAAGLERAGLAAAAEAAYVTATEAWPENSASWLALANLRYAAGDLSGAETALRQAVAADSEDAAALNNLAHVLMERGKLAEAEATATRAVALGGPHGDAAERTLAEIRARAG